MSTPQPPQNPAASAAGFARLPRKDAPTRLRKIGARIIALTDPLPMPSPMSAAEGEWVRANVLPPALTVIDDAYPYGFHRWCACQRGTCHNCLVGRCDGCFSRQHGGPHVDDKVGTVTDGHGYTVALIVHLPHQRPCRWVCCCPCPKTGPAPEPPHKARGKKARPATPARPEPPHPDDPAPGGQLDLFPETTP